MPKNKHQNEAALKSPDSEYLRHEAELIAIQENAKIPETFDIKSYDETLELIHELQVHKIELEMQNEALRQAQAALSIERERYYNLYNLAPVGYCTLTTESLIIEANLTAAKLFGMDQSKLVQQPLTRFIHSDDQDRYYLFHKKLLNALENVTCGLHLKNQNGAYFWVSVVASLKKMDDGSTQVRLVFTDTTEKNI
jgi:PAS domain S-box-containing protein